MLKSVRLTELESWKKLQEHFSEIKDLHIKDLFKSDPQRFGKFSVSEKEFLFDYSKNRVTEETLELLQDLAKEADLSDAIDKMFSGVKINATENRAVLHTALRNFSTREIYVDGEDVMPLVHEQLKRIERFSYDVISGKIKGFTGKKITHIVNIGIGGSDLGPAMVCEALKSYQIGPDVSFVSNVDGAHLTDALKKCDAETTLFVVVSKTFTTQETMTNAKAAREWLLSILGSEKAVRKHFVAVSTNSEAVKEFGIDENNQFIFWDWVGGRYSLWSSVGLSIAMHLGYENFENLLIGAHHADEHFRTRKFSENIPVIQALIGLWYVNFFRFNSYGILPYHQHLNRFPAYLQQCDMESNGKAVSREGEALNYETGPVIWGEPGTNGQHAFYQLIHQGTQIIPCDFIGVVKPNHDLYDHNDKLISNFIAQTEALMNGRTYEEVISEMKSSNSEVSESLAKHKVFKGNRPTNSILLTELNPFSLGMLTAFYEHKTYVQGYLWNIFSFDQWGVELGKQLASKVLQTVQGVKASESMDSSTAGLVEIYLKGRKTDS